MLIRKMVELLLTSAVYFTPVRKGTLRGSWRIAVGRANLSDAPTIDQDGQRTISRGMAQLGRTFNPYSNIQISNVAKYASWVELGTDRMVGQFMLERAKLEVEKASLTL